MPLADMSSAVSDVLTHSASASACARAAHRQPCAIGGSAVCESLLGNAAHAEREKRRLKEAVGDLAAAAHGSVLLAAAAAACGSMLLVLIAASRCISPV
jgi:hypothetical protein